MVNAMMVPLQCQEPGQGVVTQIKKEEPCAVYTNSYGHTLNLTCIDIIKQCEVINDALNVTQEICKLVKKTPHRDAILHRGKEQLSDNSTGIKVDCKILNVA